MALGITSAGDNKVGIDDGKSISVSCSSPASVYTNYYQITVPPGYNRIRAGYDDDVYAVYATQYTGSK